MSIVQPILTQDQKTQITNYINSYRNRNQAPPMAWDDTITTFSQQWSYTLDASNTFVHSHNPLYGENLAYFQGYGTDVITLLQKSIDNWYNEIALYDFNNPGFSEATGHFTALVWKSSTMFGMGISINPATSTAYVVLNTFPPGNVIGQFEQNVLPISGTVPVTSHNPQPLPSTPEVPNIPVDLTTVINGIYNLIHQLKTNQSSAITVPTLNSVISELNSITTVNPNVISSLYYIYYMIQSNQPKRLIIKHMYNILYELLA